MDDQNELRLADEGDARLSAMLRDVYAPPADPSYWEGLETRILSLVAAHRMGVVRLQPSLWSVLGKWSAPGMAAAAALVIVAGLLWSRENEAQLQTTYEEVSEPTVIDTLPGAVYVVTAPRDGSSQREATFRYVLSH